MVSGDEDSLRIEQFLNALKSNDIKFALKRVRVSNFRAFENSGWVDINNSLTVLLGANRSGKSSFLRAMEKMNPTSSFQDFDLTRLGELSNSHLSGNLEGSDIPIISVTFSAEGLSSDLFIITRYFDHSYKFNFADSSYEKRFFESNTSLNLFLSNSSRILSTFESEWKKVQGNAPNNQITNQINSSIANIKNLCSSGNTELSKINTEIEAIKALNPHEALKTEIQELQNSIKNEISDLNERKIISEDFSPLFELLPKFVYFSSYDRLEDKVTLNELRTNPNQHLTMINLLKMADVNLEKLGSMDSITRISYLQKASSKINSKLSRVWESLEGEGNGGFSINYENDENIIVMIAPEGSEGDLVPPSSESEGFQWFLGVFINLEERTKGDYSNSVLLLDDLGVLLHPGKQKSFMSFLQNDLPNGIPKIYATHLPFLIPLDSPSSVLFLNRTGKKISLKDMLHLKNKGDYEADVWAPVRASLGFSMMDSLFVGKFSILVEGISDQIIFQHLLKRYEKKKNSIGNKEALIIGMNNSSMLSSFSKWLDLNQLPFGIILDNDDEGRNRKEKLIKDEIPEVVIHLIEMIGPNKKSNVTVEDLIPPEIVAQAFTDINDDKKDFDKLLKNLKEKPDSTVTTLKKWNKKFDKKKLAEQIGTIIDNSPNEDLDELSKSIFESVFQSQ